MKSFWSLFLRLVFTTKKIIDAIYGSLYQIMYAIKLCSGFFFIENFRDFFNVIFKKMFIISQKKLTIITI